jgi:hypothetical protein
MMRLLQFHRPRLRDIDRQMTIPLCPATDFQVGSRLDQSANPPWVVAGRPLSQNFASSVHSYARAWPPMAAFRARGRAFCATPDAKLANS